MKAALFHRFSHWELALPLTTEPARSFTRRTVLELRLDCGRGSVYTEAAPLPGLHAEAVEDLLKHLPAVRRVLDELDEGQGDLAVLAALERGLQQQGVPPSLVWALGWAWSQAAGLVSTLPEEAPESAALLVGPPAHWVDEWREAGKARVVKVKVARAAVEDEAAGLVELGRHGSGLELRLDANGRWSLEEALRIQSLCASVDVAHMEDPVSTRAELEAYQRQGTWPLALDLRQSYAQGEEMVQPRAWVLKPQLLGLGKVLGLLGGMKVQGTPLPIISSSFESPRGMLALRSLAALVPGTAPGLGTARWFTGRVLDEAWRLWDSTC